MERADLLALVSDVYCDFVIFPFGILGQVWYMIVSILDPCCIFTLYPTESLYCRKTKTPVQQGILYQTSLLGKIELNYSFH